MGGQHRVPLAQGRAVANEVLQALWGAVVRGEIAGSIRRGKADVGDVELLLQPRPIVEQLTFGGSAIPSYDTAIPSVRALIASGLLRKAPTLRSADGSSRAAPFGDRYQKVIHVQSGLQCDLFWVYPPAQFGLQLLIRTGPAKYSQAYVTKLHRFGLQARDGRVVKNLTGEDVPTPEEADCYRLIHEPYVRPEDRMDP